MAKELFLLVDDQKDNLVSLGALIKNFFPGSRIHSAMSGVKGIELALAEEPDVIILDIQMPQMDGFMVCEELKKDTRTEQIPIIMLTARHVHKEDRIKGLGLGAISFLTKPIDDGDLLVQLKVAFRIRRAETKLRENIDRLEISVAEKAHKIVESEKKFRNYVETSQDLIWDCDAKGRFTYLNPAWEQVTGYKLKEMLGKSFTKYIIKDEVGKNTAEFQRHLKGGSVKGFSSTYISKNGSEITLIINAISKYDSNKNVIGTQGSAFDITQHKQMEINLADERNKLKTILETMEAGITIRDIDYNILYQNRVVDNIFGNRKGEKCYKVFEGFDKVCPECPVELAYRDGKSHTSIRKVVLPSGETTFWENIANPIRSPEGKIISCLELNNNITERIHANEAARQYEHIVSSSTDMLALLDKQYHYTAVNNAYVRAFKLTAVKMIGNTVANIFGEEFFNTIIKPNADRCLEGEAVNYEGWFDFPAHGRRYMEINYFPYYNKDNKVAGFVVSGRNITQRKKTEDVLSKKIEDLQRFNRLTVDRELKMIQLKREVNDLLEKTGIEKKYTIV